MYCTEEYRRISHKRVQNTKDDKGTVSLKDRYKVQQNTETVRYMVWYSSTVHIRVKICGITVETILTKICSVTVKKVLK